MTKELEPCPFCGGAAKMYEGRYSNDGRMDKPWVVKCSNFDCDAEIRVMPEYGEGNYWWRHGAEGMEHMREVVSERWNARYKRTCHFFPSFDRDIWGIDGAKHMLEEYLAQPQQATLSTMDLPDCYECSVCSWQVKQKPPAWMMHCANCGAEVVDD